MGNLFCCVQVDESTVAFKERFGKFEEELGPGCHFLPWILGYRLAGKLSFGLQQLDVLCQTKTKDNNYIDVVASVQFRVLKAIDAFYKLSNVGTLIETYVIHGIGASVPKLNLDDVFEQQNEIAKAIEEELEKVMSDYGYEIVQTLVVDIMPNLHVKWAINEINAEDRKMKLQIKHHADHLDELTGGCHSQHHAIVDTVRGFAENVPGTTAPKVGMDKARDLVPRSSAVDPMARSRARATDLRDHNSARIMGIVAKCNARNGKIMAPSFSSAMEFNFCATCCSL